MELISKLNAISKTLEGITVQATVENLNRLLGVQQTISELIEEAMHGDSGNA